MLLKLTSILVFALIAFGIAILLYPPYIRLLRQRKMGKTIREASVTGEKAPIFAALHAKKAGTPTMGGGIFLIVMGIMVVFSYCFREISQIQDFFCSLHTSFCDIDHTLRNRKETMLLLTGFFSMGVLGIIDDIMNITGQGKIKGLGAGIKLVGMFAFAAFIAYRFYVKLGVHSINIRPLNELFAITPRIDIGWGYPVLVFLTTVGIVNAINITDGLDGLAGGMMVIILMVLSVVTFSYQTYIATTILGVLCATLVAFLWYNINPARVFMGDSGAYALGGLLAPLLFLLDMRGGMIIPFVLLFSIFIVDTASSFLQIASKRLRGQKLFPVAPFHHYLEYIGMAETTIVMRFWLLQGVLAVLALVMIFYLLHSKFYSIIG